MSECSACFDKRTSKRVTICVCSRFSGHGGAISFRTSVFVGFSRLLLVSHRDGRAKLLLILALNQRCLDTGNFPGHICGYKSCYNNCDNRVL